MMYREQSFDDDTTLWSACCDCCHLALHDENGVKQYPGLPELKIALGFAGWRVDLETALGFAGWEKVLCPGCQEEEKCGGRNGT